MIYLQILWDSHSRVMTFSLSERSPRPRGCERYHNLSKEFETIKSLVASKSVAVEIYTMRDTGSQPGVSPGRITKRQDISSETSASAE